MRVAEGVPMMLSSKGKVRFPLSGKNVFTLENARGSRIYDGVKAQKELLREEYGKIQAITDGFRAKN